MFLVRPPDAATVQRFVDAQSRLPMSYPEVGATRGELPAGYAIDRYGVVLGRGAGTMERARAAVRAWKVYPADWATPWAHEPPREGLTYAVVIRHFSFASLNACRVVYTIEDRGEIERDGFALGTLPGHEERGEERFCVSWDRGTDVVRYDVLAFSRPRRAWVRLATPVTRALQALFARDTQRSMLDACRE